MFIKKLTTGGHHPVYMHIYIYIYIYMHMCMMHIQYVTSQLPVILGNLLWQSV